MKSCFKPTTCNLSPYSAVTETSKGEGNTSPVQICVSAPPQLQRGHGHFHQLDSAYNEQLLHQTGPNETCPAPGMGAEMAKISSTVKNMHYSIHIYRRHSDFGCESLVENLSFTPKLQQIVGNVQCYLKHLFQIL